MPNRTNSPARPNAVKPAAASRRRQRRKPRNIADDEAFELIGISDDIMFKAVFGNDPELAGRLLDCVLEREVGTVEYVNSSEEVRPEWDARATTFDIYLRTESGMLGEVEMQTGRKSELPLRLRTHLSNMDREALKRGEGYMDAQESISVFICTFDPLGDGLTRYTICRKVEETGKRFPDRQTGVFLNATGDGNDVSPELAAFLRYVAGYDGAEEDQGGFVDAVDERVRANRRSWKWRRGYMTLQEKLDEAREEGIALGETRMLARLVLGGTLDVARASEVGGVPEDDVRAAVEALRAGA